MKKKSNPKFSQVVERLAPSPTGGLHLGHVFSALTAFRNAKKNQGLLKLRVEDIDSTRCKRSFEKEIIRNLTWLGITWDGKIMRQRYRKKYYGAALDHLLKNGLLYPCSCSRADIKNAISAPHTDEKLAQTYPGTCRNSSTNKPIKALRLNIAKAIKLYPGKYVSFLGSGPASDCKLEQQTTSKMSLEARFGDLIIARSDIGTSYNLAVVIDDAAQNVTHVSRGNDLFSITPIQILLQFLLNLPTPVYYHHALLYEQSGKKISKRSSPKSVSTLQRNGFTPDEVIGLAFQLAQN